MDDDGNYCLRCGDPNGTPCSSCGYLVRRKAPPVETRPVNDAVAREEK